MIKKKQQTAKVITPAGMKPKPRQHERDAAEILALHFNTFVEFLPRANGKSADFIIDGVIWELKSPTGTGKHNIKRQLQYAKHQSVNVIIDAGRSKLHKAKIRREVEYQFGIVKSVKRLLFISKDKNVVEIKRWLCIIVSIEGSSAS